MMCASFASAPACTEIAPAKFLITVLDRETLARMVQAYLANGGRITRCPAAGTGPVAHNENTIWNSAAVRRSRRARKAARRAPQNQVGAGGRALDARQRDELRALYTETKVSKAELARHFGISKTTVRACVNDLEPRHV